MHNLPLRFQQTSTKKDRRCLPQKRQKVHNKNPLECCCSKSTHKPFKKKKFGTNRPAQHKIESSNCIVMQNIRIQSQNSLAHTGSFRKNANKLSKIAKKTVHFYYNSVSRPSFRTDRIHPAKTQSKNHKLPNRKYFQFLKLFFVRESGLQ